MENITLSKIESALRAIPPNVTRHEWIKIAAAIHDANPAWFDIFHQWSQASSNYQSEKDCKTAWASLTGGGGVTAGYLFKAAKDHGWEPEPTATPGLPANTAGIPFESLKVFESHPYIDARGLADKVNGYAPTLRAGRDSYGEFIADPLFNLKTGEITGYNRIYRTGKSGKMLAAGTKKTGNAGILGRLEGAQKIIVAAGFADCLHLHFDTGLPVLNAQDDGNMIPVISAFLELETGAEIVAFTDSDSGSGIPTAENISKKFPSVKIAFPPTYKDASDLANTEGGAEKISALLGLAETGTGAVKRFALTAIKHEIESINTDSANSIEPVIKPIIRAIARHVSSTDADFLLNRIKAKAGIDKAPLNRLFKDAKWQEKIADQAKRGIDNALVTFTDKGAELLKQSIAAITLAELQTGNIKNLRYNDLIDDWLYFGGKIWIKLTKTRANNEISRAIDEQAGELGYDRNYRDGVKDFLAGRLSHDKWDDKPGLLPLKNSILNLSTKQTEAYTQEHYFTWCLPFDYDTQADCPLIKQFILDSVESDESQAQVLRAYMKAVVTGRADLQRYIEIIGEGGTGKGTFMRLLMGLVGEGNYVSTDFKRLEGRFENGRLYGKRLCLITDAEKHMGAVDIFKMITGQDPIPYEEKHKSTKKTDFIYGGMVFIAANSPITSGEYTSAMSRRRIVINFNARIEKRDPALGDKLNAELPGLLSWVINMDDSQMIAALSDTANFSPSTGAAMLGYQWQTNSVAAWVHENIVLDHNAQSQVGGNLRESRETDDGARINVYAFASERLFPNYLTWCDATSRRNPLSLQKFTDALLSVMTAKDALNMPEITHTRAQNKSRFVGIRLRTDADTDALSPFEIKAKGISQEEAGRNSGAFVI